MTQTLVPPTATPTTGDRIRSVTLSHVVLPLPNPVSDAKVLTGRQKPLTETVMLFVELTTEQGLEGMGFSYSKRAGGKGQYAHLKEVIDVAIGQDPNDIAKIYESLMWAGASVGRSGVATQAVAALDVALYDLKARRAGLPLAKLLGAHRDSCRVYNTSGGFLQASVEEIKEKATASLESGIGGIKIKVGQPDWRDDLRRVAAIREHLGDGPFMVDANQQWDRARARRMCRELEQFDLIWIEEPLDAWTTSATPTCRSTFDTPIATGEMLTSVAEHMGLVDAGYRGIVQPDAPRIGGITPFLNSRRSRRTTASPRAALRDGDPPAPRGGVPHRAVGRALRVARPALRRAPRHPRRPDLRPGPSGPRLHAHRPDARAHRGTATFVGMTTLSGRVVAGLKDKILAGELAPGAKLPVRVGAHRGVRRLAHRRARGGDPAPGRGPGRDPAGARFLVLAVPSRRRSTSSRPRSAPRPTSWRCSTSGSAWRARNRAGRAAPHGCRRLGDRGRAGRVHPGRARGGRRGRLRLPPRRGAGDGQPVHVDLPARSGR